MTPIIHYLKEGWLTEDKTKVKKIQIKATRFVIIDDVLYRRGYSLLYLRCVNLEEVDYKLHKIHKGICGNHAGASSLARKAIKARYYWLTLQKDAHDLVRAYNKCQRFTNVQMLTSISFPWPFAQNG